MSQKAGLSIHKIDGRGNFQYKGFYIVFGRELNGRVIILDHQWQDVLNEKEHLSVEDAISTIDDYHLREQYFDDNF